MDSYAAGLIDGEGYIGLHETNQGAHFTLSLEISMTDKGLPALNRMAAMYGGKVANNQAATSVKREAFKWRLSGRAAATVIRAVRPGLLVKAPAADIALEFWSMVENAPRLKNGNAQWSADMRRLGRMYVARIKEANRRGPDPVLPSTSPIAVYAGGSWWEPDDSLFGPVPFTGRFPASGSMRSGRVFELASLPLA